MSKRKMAPQASKVLMTWSLKMKQLDSMSINKMAKQSQEEYRKKKAAYRNRPETKKLIMEYFQDPDVKDRIKDRYLKRHYGISLEDYYLKMIEQDECCSICKRHISELNINYFDVDHCHTTGKFRGLLCNGCNLGIELFKENIERLKNAIKYISKHSK